MTGQDEQSTQLLATLKKHIDAGKLEVPLLTTVVSQVLMMVGSADADAGKLAQLIQSDQALTGHVMRITNSPAYRGAAQLVSLQQAVARLGLQLISEIALVAASGPKLFRVDPYTQLVDESWRHALACGSWAKEIARLNHSNVEIAFLCGILCQIGKPTILQAMLGINKAAVTALSREQIEAIINDNHTLAGAYIAKQWQLPAAVEEVINFLGGRKCSDNHEELYEIVTAALQMATLHSEEQLDDLDQLQKDPTLLALHLYAEDIEKLWLKREKVRNTVEALSL